MLPLLVLPAWIAAFLIFRRVLLDWREAALSACIVWGIIVIVLTEGLSLFHALAFVPLVVVWGLISSVSLAVIVRLWPGNLQLKVKIAGFFRQEGYTAAVLVGGTCLTLLAIVVAALTAPPNTWDSMTYHMARVANWVDHRSVRNYPTNITRQLYMGPWSEFAITHLQILHGSDRFANCVQYFAMLGSVVGVSLLAKKLGVAIRGQLLASVFCATIPMGILQASSTQTDYVMAFWFLCFLCFTIDLIYATTPYPRGTAALAGASLGLAALTKMSALVLAAPFLLWVTFALFRKRRAGPVFQLAIVAAVALLINSGHILRNERTFGWPLGPRAETAWYMNEIHTPAAVASNVIRNLAVEMGVPPGDEGILGGSLLTAKLRIHEWTGMDINDPRTTFLDTRFNFSPSLTMGEDDAGNPLHLLLAGFAMIVALWNFRCNRPAAVYSACIAAAFLVFCGYLKWQPWIARLHLPLFVAAAPVFGLLLSRDVFRRVAPFLAMLLLFVGSFYATAGRERPLVGQATILSQPRTNLYFASKGAIRDPYFAAAAKIARGDPSRIGIISGIDDWEYPLRVLIRARLGKDVRFEHIDVQNPSRYCPPELPPNRGTPDEIVVIGSYNPQLIPVGYHSVFTSNEIRVFEP